MLRSLAVADPGSLELLLLPTVMPEGSPFLPRPPPPNPCQSLILSLAYSVEHQGLLCQRSLAAMLFKYAVFLGPLAEIPTLAQPCIYR